MKRIAYTNIALIKKERGIMRKSLGFPIAGMSFALIVGAYSACAQYSPLPPRYFSLGEQKETLSKGDSEHIVTQKLGLMPDTVEETSCGVTITPCKINGYRNKDQILWVYFRQDQKAHHHWLTESWKIENFWNPQSPFDPQ